MHTSSVRALALVTVLCTAAAATSDAHLPTLFARTQAQMVSAALQFTSLLDETQRARAVYAFEDEARYDWHFVPRERTGLPFKAMTPEQRTAGHALLQSAMSTTGYLKATSIMQLERILGQLENQPDRRDPENYFFWIFGTPSVDSPWAWRIEGHHLSVSFTSVTGNVVVSTPAFMGANPATVRSGPFAGWRILGGEEDAGRALLLSLTAAQRAIAVISDSAPRDIITGADRHARLNGFEGLRAADMTAEQRAGLMRVIHEYVGNMDPEIAEPRLEKIRDAGIENLYFAWAGSAEPGRGHYYRIHGPTVLFEYDNTQSNANHVHSVWRDLADDFGEDLLRRHYEEADHHE